MWRRRSSPSIEKWKQNWKWFLYNFDHVLKCPSYEDSKQQTTMEVAPKDKEEMHSVVVQILVNFDEELEFIEEWLGKAKHEYFCTCHVDGGRNPSQQRGSLPIPQVPIRIMNVWCGRLDRIMDPLPF